MQYGINKKQNRQFLLYNVKAEAATKTQLETQLKAIETNRTVILPRRRRVDLNQ